MEGALKGVWVSVSCVRAILYIDDKQVSGGSSGGGAAPAGSGAAHDFDDDDFQEGAPPTDAVSLTQ